MDYTDVVSRVKVPKEISVISNYGVTSNKSDAMIENTPISGFEFIASPSSYDYPGQVTVKDPRGFTVTLLDEAARQLLLTATLQNGEILDECVWAFVTPLQARLLPTSSDVYQAVTNTCKVTPRNLKRGSIVKVISRKGNLVYLGKYNTVIDKDYWRSNSTSLTQKKQHVFIEQGSKTIYILNTPKIFCLVGETKDYDSWSVDMIHAAFVKQMQHYGSEIYAVTSDEVELIDAPMGTSVEFSYALPISARSSRNITLTLKDGEVHYTKGYELPRENTVKKWYLIISRNTYYEDDIASIAYPHKGFMKDGKFFSV